jgi:hypothetical protein
MCKFAAVIQPEMELHTMKIMTSRQADHHTSYQISFRQLACTPHTIEHVETNNYYFAFDSTNKSYVRKSVIFVGSEKFETKMKTSEIEVRCLGKSFVFFQIFSFRVYHQILWGNQKLLVLVFFFANLKIDGNLCLFDLICCKHS